MSDPLCTDERLALLVKARDALTELSLCPGTFNGFRHIKYCRFCSYSQEWIAKNGHGKQCVLAELDEAIKKAGET